MGEIGLEADSMTNGEIEHGWGRLATVVSEGERGIEVRKRQQEREREREHSAGERENKKNYSISFVSFQIWNGTVHLF